MTTSLTIQLFALIAAPITYTSRHLSTVIVGVYGAILAYLIIATGQIADIITYVGQLESEIYYEREFLYALVQKASVYAGFEPEMTVKALQLTLAGIFFFVMQRSSRCAVFAFFPFFQIFVLNSLRQGFATAGIALGTHFLLRRKPVCGGLCFAAASGFHASSVAISTILFLAYAFWGKFQKLHPFTVFSGTLLLLSAFIFISDLAVGYLGYSSYVRAEDFYGRDRESLLSRTLFFAVYGVTPFFYYGSGTLLGKKILFVRLAAYTGVAILVNLNLADAATRIGYYFMALDALLITQSAGVRYRLFNSRRFGYAILMTAILNPAGAKMTAMYIESL